MSHYYVAQSSNIRPYFIQTEGDLSTLWESKMVRRLGNDVRKHFGKKELRHRYSNNILIPEQNSRQFVDDTPKYIFCTELRHQP